MSAGAILVVVLGLTGCSGTSGPGAGGTAGNADSAAAPSTSRAMSRADTGPEGAVGSAASSRSQPEQAAQVTPQEASVISTGDVALTARDVAACLTDVRRAVSAAGGSVQKESTDTDGGGRAGSADLTVRVPSAEFTQVMADLGRAGTLVSTSSRSRDVTTVVLDNQVRVQVARRSIDRISTLLDQATSIRDVISIEGELSQRQADLASLETQQKYLADQTSLATITVSIDRATTSPAPERHTTLGFTAGLGAGWHALARTARASATGAGAVLPWLVLVVLIGVPVRLGVRRRRRSASTRTA